MKVKVTILECDREGCSYFEVVPEPKINKRKLDSERKKRGWGIEGKTYHCPECFLRSNKETQLKFFKQD